MFKVPDTQVAGHHAEGGQLGPLIDDSGRFYKPLQSKGRGLHELEFYTKFASLSEIPDHIRGFFPVFSGSKTIEASDGSGPCVHIILQDLMFGRTNPSVMDIKMGSRTWYPQASDSYIQKCLQKDRESTSVSLGFRVSGLQVYTGEDSGPWKPAKNLVRSFSHEDVRLVLKRFVSSNPSLDKDTIPDCLFASLVYGGSDGVLAQLKKLKEWFEGQTLFHFYSCSVLMLFEKETAEKSKIGSAEVKLVDFAHVVDGDGVIDHNFLGSLCSLIKFISDIVKDADKEDGV